MDNPENDSSADGHQTGSLIEAELEITNRVKNVSSSEEEDVHDVTFETSVQPIVFRFLALFAGLIALVVFSFKCS